MLSRFSCVRLFATLRTVVAHQAPLSMGFSWQKYWNGWLCSPPGDLPDPGIDPASLMSLALAGEFFTTWEAQRCWIYKQVGLSNVLCEHLYVEDLVYFVTTATGN